MLNSIRRRRNLSYEEARAIARSCPYFSKRDYQRAEDLPLGLVRNPAVKYREEFLGWDDFLGNSSRDDPSYTQEILVKISETQHAIWSFKRWEEMSRCGLISSYFPTRINKYVSKAAFKDCSRYPNIYYIAFIIARFDLFKLKEYQGFLKENKDLKDLLPVNIIPTLNENWSTIKALALEVKNEQNSIM